MNYFRETDDEGYAELERLAAPKPDAFESKLLKLAPGECKFLPDGRFTAVARRSPDGKMLQWALLRRPVSLGTAAKRLAEEFDDSPFDYNKWVNSGKLRGRKGQR